MQLFDYITKHARNNKSHIALKCETKEITYGQLEEVIQLNRNKLYQLGFQTDDKVLVLYENPLDWIIGFLSALSLNCKVLPLDSHVEDHKIAQLKETLEEIKILNPETYNILYEGKKEVSICPIAIDAKKAGILHLTSGSTSTPKLCQRTLRGLTAEGISFKETLQITQEDKILGLPPLYHSYALGASLMTSLVAGATLVQTTQFKPRQALQNIIKEQVSIVILVPLMAKVLSSIARKHTGEFKKLRFALSGAGKVEQELYDKFKNTFGVNLMCNYGSTETGGMITRVQEECIGSIGKPMQGVFIKIKDEEGRSVTKGHQGELWVKSEEIMETYYHHETPFDEEGYFPMGDIVYENEAGYLFVVSRKKSIVKIGGKTVNLNAIEQVVCQLPGVIECAVMSKEKNDSSRIKLIVHTTKSYTKEEMVDYCKTKLDQYHVPHEILFTTELKRNSIGKLDLSKFI